MNRSQDKPDNLQRFQKFFSTTEFYWYHRFLEVSLEIRGFIYLNSTWLQIMIFYTTGVGRRPRDVYTVQRENVSCHLCDGGLNLPLLDGIWLRYLKIQVRPLWLNPCSRSIRRPKVLSTTNKRCIGKLSLVTRIKGLSHLFRYTPIMITNTDRSSKIPTIKKMQQFFFVTIDIIMQQII